jgi:hypothetical protein
LIFERKKERKKERDLEIVKKKKTIEQNNLMD